MRESAMSLMTRIGNGCSALVLCGCAANDEVVAASLDDDLGRAGARISQADIGGAHE